VINSGFFFNNSSIFCNLGCSKKNTKTIILMAFDIEMIKKVYENMPGRVDKARELVGRPLTLTEKILYNHLWDGAPSQVFKRGVDYVDFAPDRVACQDATAQMALLQFTHAGKSKVAVPTTYIAIT